MVDYNPYIIGQYNLLYTPTNQGFFHCSFELVELDKRTRRLRLRFAAM